MKNILLIEDEENLNRGISLKLKKEGYAVFSAACVSEGLKLFQDNTIDLVICDIGLPDGSGLDLCANIRQRSDVLFLFLTARPEAAHHRDSPESLPVPPFSSVPRINDRSSPHGL